LDEGVWGVRGVGGGEWGRGGDKGKSREEEGREEKKGGRKEEERKRKKKEIEEKRRRLGNLQVST